MAVIEGMAAAPSSPIIGSLSITRHCESHLSDRHENSRASCNMLHGIVNIQLIIDISNELLHFDFLNVPRNSDGNANAE